MRRAALGWQDPEASSPSGSGGGSSLETAVPERQNPDPEAVEPFGPGLQAQAFGLDYSYADARIVFGDLTGLSAEGSYSINDDWFAVGHLVYGTDSDVDFQSLSAGAGYRFPINLPNLPGQLDVVATAELEYGRIEVERTVFGTTVRASDSEIGLRLRGGARYRFNRDWEFRAGLGLRTIFDTEVVLDVAGQYNINDQWALVSQLDLGSEFVLFGIGARVNF